MPPTASLTSAAPQPAEPLLPAVPDSGVDLAESGDPRRLIPGDPAGLRAAARALHDNAALHEANAVRQRHLHDGGWTGAAADAFHAHLARQAVRHAAATDATRAAADALTELADGIEQARTHAGRAAALHADSDPGQRDERRGADPALREQARDLLDDTRARLADVHARVRDQLAAARARLPDPHRLLSDPDPDRDPAAVDLSAALPTPLATDGPAPRAADFAAPTAIGPAAAAPPRQPDTTEGPVADSTHEEGPSIVAGRAARRVVVRRGDTLSAIAARYLGDASRWPEILDRNPAIEHPWQIRPGQTVALPDATPPARAGAPTRHSGTPARPPADPSIDDDANSGSGHPPPHPSSPGGTSGPTTGPLTEPTAVGHSPDPAGGDDGLVDRPADRVHHDSDAGGVGLENGLFIGGGLAAALSAAYLLRQRRRDRTCRPGIVTDLADPADLPRGPKAGSPAEIQASSRGALDPAAAGGVRPAVDELRDVSRAPVAAEPPVAPVVRRLYYAYQRRSRPAGLIDLTGVTAAGSPPALQPSLLPSDGSRSDTVGRHRPRLLVPLGVTAGGASVAVDLTGTPILALTPETQTCLRPPTGPTRLRLSTAPRSVSGAGR